MIIQSHRGAGNLAPENTIESFRLGWELGMIPEADIRCTKDGVPVAFHDNDFQRLVKDAPAELRPLHIEDLTWEEVSKLEVGAWKDEKYRGQRIPRLIDIYEQMQTTPGSRLYLDVKGGTIEQFAELTRNFGLNERVILASTVNAHLVSWSKLVPGFNTLLWMGASEERLRERMAENRAANFEGITQLQIHVYVPDLTAEDPFSPSSGFLREVGEEIKPRGILFQSLAFNRGETEIFHRLMDLGVESFATDEPLSTLEAVKSYQPK